MAKQQMILYSLIFDSIITLQMPLDNRIDDVSMREDIFCQKWRHLFRHLNPVCSWENIYSRTSCMEKDRFFHLS